MEGSRVRFERGVYTSTECSSETNGLFSSETKGLFSSEHKACVVVNNTRAAELAMRLPPAVAASALDVFRAALLSHCTSFALHFACKAAAPRFPVCPRPPP
eukprot:1119049-Rhodomonas_salina.1